MNKTYSKGDLDVSWEPKKCIHSEKCVKGLPGVFNPQHKPWIDLNQAEADAIRKQVRACPSGALSLPDDHLENHPDALQLEVMANGPVLVKSDCEVIMPDGKREMKQKMVALCRCGGSANKPYCDGTHSSIDFKG